MLQTAFITQRMMPARQVALRLALAAPATAQPIPVVTPLKQKILNSLKTKSAAHIYLCAVFIILF